MNLLCKCGHQLTNRSLFPRKTWHMFDIWVETIDEGTEDEWTYKDCKYEIKEGSFLTKRHWLTDKPVICVNKGNVVDGAIEEYRSGLGCCDVSMGDVNCPSCKDLVGMADLDCYQMQHVGFFEHKVVRSYK